ESIPPPPIQNLLEIFLDIKKNQITTAASNSFQIHYN
ncbi:MAG: hypothetical protein ACJAZ2_002374, partial [Glaciecola sp.]